MKAFIITWALLSQLGGTLASWSPPSGAISWDNLQQVRVYGVDPTGEIQEWQWENTGFWTGPSPIGATALIGTTVTATNDGASVRVYYITPDGQYKERVYENGWSDGKFSAILP